jgi:hypothetical protein
MGAERDNHEGQADGEAPSILGEYLVAAVAERCAFHPEND